MICLQFKLIISNTFEEKLTQQTNKQLHEGLNSFIRSFILTALVIKL